MFEAAPGLYLVLDRDLHIVAVSDPYLRATMTERHAIVGRHLFDVFPDNPEDPAADGVGNLHASLRKVLATKRPDTMAVQKYDIRKEDGDWEERFWSPVNSPVLEADGAFRFIIHRVEDVTEFIRLKGEDARKDERAKELLSGVERMEAEVFERAREVQAANRRLEVAYLELDKLRRETDEKNALLMATARDAKFVLDADQRIVEANAEAVRMLGRDVSDIVGRGLTEFFPKPEKSHSLALRREGAVDLFVDIASAPIPIGATGQSLFVVREVTDRTRLEEQLRQSQKLEAIGQLTGGVAHDFNNLLTVIASTSEMLHDRLANQPKLLSLVDMIDKAADRGAKLTHRMLAFARRQPLSPRSVNLNEIAAGVGDMLQRVLGDDITLSTDLADDLWPVLADSSQIEDALLNLGVNARDAMPKGGQLVIQTANTRIENDDIAFSRDLTPGDYVALTVSDTGIGMDADVVARAVEPFFTTKGVGEGTGLGLSMIYGFVKQSNGALMIYSEVGFGTSVKLFLPRAVQAAAPEEARNAPFARATGETILVVEDDPDVREVALAMLEGLGYMTRQAPDGPSAIAIIKADRSIQLLFTDLMMPGGMSGIHLLEEARRLRPELKAVLTSGYPTQLMEKRGVTPADAPLLGKPYRKRALSEAIRKALDS